MMLALENIKNQVDAQQDTIQNMINDLQDDEVVDPSIEAITDPLD